jgi:ATP-binding cassette, subfamily B, bacterial HlyB/CyaB
VVYASARIDVRTSTRTFELLLSLSIDFFERVSAGVITKHMQQVKKIREFLTGRLLLTLLDATSLLVVVPLLFIYSRVLAMLVLGFSAFTACVIGALVPIYRRRLRALYEVEVCASRASSLSSRAPGVSSCASPAARCIWPMIGKSALSVCCGEQK